MKVDALTHVVSTVTFCTQAAGSEGWRTFTVKSPSNAKPAGKSISITPIDWSGLNKVNVAVATVSCPAMFEESVTVGMSVDETTSVGTTPLSISIRSADIVLISYSGVPVTRIMRASLHWRPTLTLSSIRECSIKYNSTPSAGSTVNAGTVSDAVQLVFIVSFHAKPGGSCTTMKPPAGTSLTVQKRKESVTVSPEETIRGVIATSPGPRGRWDRSSGIQPESEAGSPNAALYMRGWSNTHVSISSAPSKDGHLVQECRTTLPTSVTNCGKPTLYTSTVTMTLYAMGVRPSRRNDTICPEVSTWITPSTLPSILLLHDTELTSNAGGKVIVNAPSMSSPRVRLTMKVTVPRAPDCAVVGTIVALSVRSGWMDQTVRF
eukprot:752421-Rhodomonas_salina.1